MKRLLMRLLIVALVGGVAFLVLRWPRVNDVETGNSKAYPDLAPHTYVADGPRVFGAAKEAVNRLPGWRLGGSGFGPAGWTVQGLHRLPLLPVREEIMIRIRREKGQTVVSLRSRSEWAKWDFGQNARNIRAFYRALDEALSL
jgi:hypothetical protein